MTAPHIVLLSNDDARPTHRSRLSYPLLRCRPRDVTDAHAVVKRAQADLVILDLWLAKHEDGRAFLTRMCADLETMRIPAIIASGQSEMLPRQDELLRTMQCHVLTKPFDTKELQRAITTMLGPSPSQSARSLQLPTIPSVDHAAGLSDSLRIAAAEKAV